MNHSEKRIVLLDLIHAVICCELNRELGGHKGFSVWYDENKEAIDTTVTPQVIAEYFALQGESRSTLSKQLAREIIERMKVTV